MSERYECAAERFARMHVGQMHFDERNLHRGQCVAQGDAGMRERAGIDQDDRGAIFAGGVDAVDQLVLGVGLEADASRMPGCARLSPRASASMSASVAWP